ncbi:hypothetical protein BsWGS_01624 [Bradybaena similaris]
MIIVPDVPSLKRGYFKPRVDCRPAYSGALILPSHRQVTQTGHTDRPHRPDRQARQTGHTDRPHRQATQTGHTDRPHRADRQATQTGHTGQTDRPNRQATMTGHTDRSHRWTAPRLMTGNLCSHLTTWMAGYARHYYHLNLVSRYKVVFGLVHTGQATSTGRTMILIKIYNQY